MGQGEGCGKKVAWGALGRGGVGREALGRGAWGVGAWGRGALGRGAWGASTRLCLSASVLKDVARAAQ